MGDKAIDLRDRPSYSLAEAARYLKLPAATLRSWVVGRAYSKSGARAGLQPLIQSVGNPPLLSFYNLIEAHVIRSLQTQHGVAIKELRVAIQFAEETLDIERLLLRKDLGTHAGQVLLDEYGNLVNLSASGRLLMRARLTEYLKRIEWDERRFAVRLYPYVLAPSTASRPIAIDPKIAFGRPIVLKKGIATEAVTARIDAGETIAALAEDYDLEPQEVEEAVIYERAA